MTNFIDQSESWLLYVPAFISCAIHRRLTDWLPIGSISTNVNILCWDPGHRSISGSACRLPRLSHKPSSSHPYTPLRKSARTAPQPTQRSINTRLLVNTPQHKAHVLAFCIYQQSCYTPSCATSVPAKLFASRSRLGAFVL